MLRVYEFDRYNGTVWQVDMMLVNDSFIVHPRITNPTDKDLRGYWWTCVAIDAKPSTRVFTPATHVAETSRGSMRNAPWPYFAEGIETATHGRVPQWLSVLIGLFIGPFVIAIHQYYINRLNANKKGETYPVSSTLAIITSIFVVVGVFSFISTVSSFNASTQAIKTELIKTKERFAEVQNLNTSYTKCTAQLATDFPGDLTAENKDAYNAANEKCDKLFADYQAAMSKYLKGDRP
jgi:hypothetical protein